MMGMWGEIIERGINAIDDLQEYVKKVRPDWKFVTPTNLKKKWITRLFINDNLSMNIVYLQFTDKKANYELALIDGNDKILYDKKLGYDDVKSFKNKEDVVKEIDRIISILDKTS
jgi:hypothetical protein